MEIYSKIHYEKDRTNAMNMSTIMTIDFAAFSVRSSTSSSKKKPISVCDHCKKQWDTKDQCWKLRGRPPEVKNAFLTINRTLDGYMGVSLLHLLNHMIYMRIK